MKKTSLLLNIVLIVLLAYIFIRENYLPRLKQKFFPDNSLHYYTNRPSYQFLLSRFDMYDKQSNIVMLGTSFTQDINWNELLRRGDIANRACGGDIVEVLVSRLPYIYAVNPKICFIEGGINDVDTNVPLKETLKNFYIIIDSLQSHKIKPILTAITYVNDKAKNSKYRNQKIKEINDSLQIISTNKQVIFLNNNTLLAPTGFLKPMYCLKDGLHYTPAAYLHWQTQIENVIKQLNL